MSSQPPQEDEKASPTDSGIEGAPPAEPPDPLVGKMVAERYKVLSRIGEGGMGAVYLAEHVFIEKKMALKVLHGEYAHKQDLVQRFLHEAKAASKIDHPNVVQITDFGQTESGNVFFAMEYLKGEDLATALRANGPWKWRRAKNVFVQICHALQAAHGKGIIHRDMKPENILLIAKDNHPDFVKVLDFGIAKMSGIESSNGQRLTKTGMIFGTPEYMSPEQARGDKPDHRIDVYAVGCIMYEIMTGKVPFEADTFMGVLTKHMFDPVTPPRQMNSTADIPPALEAIILKALEKNRDKRYASMAELAETIEQCPIEITEVTRNKRRATPSALRRITNSLLRNTGSGDAVDDLSFPTELPSEIDEGTSEHSALRGSKGLLIGVGVAATVLLLVIGLIAFGHGKGETETHAAPPPVALAAPSPAPAKPPVVAPVAPPAPNPIVAGTCETVIESNVPATVWAGTKELGPTPFTFRGTCGSPPLAAALKAHGYGEEAIEVSLDQAMRKQPVTLVTAHGPARVSRATSHYAHSAPPSPPAAHSHTAPDLAQPKDLHNPF